MLPRADMPTFAGGEISEKVSARFDTAKYATALRRARNCLILPEGGIYNRPGFEFVGEARDHSKPLWLLPFAYSATQSYVHEHGDGEMRVIYGGGYVIQPELEIAAATNSNPLTVTIPNSGYLVGDDIQFDGVEGMVELNGLTLQITAVDGDVLTFGGVDSNAWGAFLGATGGEPGDGNGGSGTPPVVTDPTPPVEDLPDPPPHTPGPPRYDYPPQYETP